MGTENRQAVQKFWSAIRAIAAGVSAGNAVRHNVAPAANSAAMAEGSPNCEAARRG
ncbi:hypothetical protein [Williamsia sp. 1135]|uniref:hypothetical protein n=1 Tax=Williamsia sp. 1135 TaxID=1889262 RepID=UPI001439AFEC|nr:hypothetical protein [Williamsia sp. 1135]